MVEYTTQRVEFETTRKIKDVQRHLLDRGVKMRQSDVIREAFKYIVKREWDFLDFVAGKYEGGGFRLF